MVEVARLGGPPDPGMSAEGAMRAAGAVIWRGHGATLQVALVHRPKYDDWSWPKGKLDPGESWPAAAVREVREETGARITLGVPLRPSNYQVGTPKGMRRKVVRYWAANGDSAEISCTQEVDALAWLTPTQASKRLDYRRDHEQLAQLVEVERQGHLAAWPLLIVRHARAVSRPDWPGTHERPARPDRERPLNHFGHQRAMRLIPILDAYGVRRIWTSDSVRCVDTVAPFGLAAERRVSQTRALSQERFATHPGEALKLLDRIVVKPKSALICSHRTVIPRLISWLLAKSANSEITYALQESKGPGLVKGEVLVAQLIGSGPRIQVVSVERHHN